MSFLPRADILSLDEIEFTARAFVALGVDKIRVTGGEPLVRKGIMGLLRNLGRLEGLRDLAITTNGSQLESMAGELKSCGVRRINISLDTLNATLFRQMTRIGDLRQVLRGIDKVLEAGLEKVKLNAVIMKNRNHGEIRQLVAFAIDKQVDISFIEEMPLGMVNTHDRSEEYYSSDKIRIDLEKHFVLLPSTESTGGPSRYYRIANTQTKVGFISPHSHNFCSTCNRVRLTSEGRLLLCLGNEHSVDLKQVLRANPGNTDALKNAILAAMRIKPESHTFGLTEKPLIFRHMSATGG